MYVEQDSLQPIDAITTQACPFPCSSRGLESDAAFDLCMSIQPDHGGGGIASSPSPSPSPSPSSHSDDLEDVEITESSDVREASPCNTEEINRKRPLPNEDLECVAACPFFAPTAMQDVDPIIISQDTNDICEEMENNGSQETLIASPRLNEDITTKTDVEHDPAPVVASVTEVDLHEQPAAKKPRLSLHAEEASNGLGESLSDDKEL